MKLTFSFDLPPFLNRNELMRESSRRCEYNLGVGVSACAFSTFKGMLYINLLTLFSNWAVSEDRLYFNPLNACGQRVWGKKSFNTTWRVDLNKTEALQYKIIVFQKQFWYGTCTVQPLEPLLLLRFWESLMGFWILLHFRNFVMHKKKIKKYANGWGQYRSAMAAFQPMWRGWEESSPMCKHSLQTGLAAFKILWVKSLKIRGVVKAVGLQSRDLRWCDLPGSCGLFLATSWS